ncbi:MAG: hypothetical protein JWQ09_204 [Segetibacter sp.]|nr:hypothetical protein [Segetibacter sp.]
MKIARGEKQNTMQFLILQTRYKQEKPLKETGFFPFLRLMLYIMFVKHPQYLHRDS